MDIERRIRRLEDRVEIGELIARYGLVMDDRDIDGMPALFTPDVVIRSDDGVLAVVLWKPALLLETLGDGDHNG